MLNYVNPYRFKPALPGCDEEYGNVVLLLPLNGANNSTTFTDVSYYGQTITRNGDAKISTDNFKFGGSSLYLDGNGDYLRAPTSTDWAFGTGDFTVEFWFYRMNTASFRISNRQEWGGASGTWGVNLGASSFSFSEIVVGEPNISVTLADPLLNQWVFYAVTRRSGVVYLFCNGELLNSGSFTTNFNNASYNLKIGTEGSVQQVQGYMNDVRITKGVARYTANFSVPTTAFPTVSCYDAILEAPGTTALVVTGGETYPLYSSNIVVANFAVSSGIVLYSNTAIQANVIAEANNYSLYTMNSYSVPMGIINVPECDLYRDNVSLLLHFEGLNGSTVMTDSSIYSHSVTSVNGTSLSTLTKRFGSSSVAFNGSNNYLTVSDNDQFNFGTGDFTVEFWVRVSAYPSVQTFLVSQWETPAGSDTNSSFAIILRANGSLYAAIAYDGINQPVADSVSSVITALNTFYNVALVKSGSTATLYVNGNAVGTSSIPGTVNNSNRPLYIGARYGDTNHFNGFMDELRITKGVARYMTAFTPDGAPFSEINCSDRDIYWSSVVLSMPMTGANASTTFTDVSSSAKTVTNTGSTTISTAQSKFGGTSALINATTKYLSLANSTDFDFSSNNFTIEFWIYATTWGSLSILLNKRSTNLNQTPILIYCASGTITARFTNTGGTEYDITGSALSTSTWYHIAYVRSGNNTYLFVNGSQVGGTIAVSGSALVNTNSLNIGNEQTYSSGTTPTTSIFYIDDLRITKGVARYTSNFSAPTAPFASQGF